MKTIIIDGIEYNLTPKVLFKKGDFVVIQETTYLISKIEGLNVTLSCNGRECLFDIDVLKNARLWDITKDAKDGDVLASNRSIFIFSQEYMAGKPKAHCGIMNGLFLVKPEGCWTNEKCYPATKEQRDQLEKAMADAGYTFDFEKKGLKKIEQNPTDADLKDIVDKEANSIWKEINTGGSYSVIDSFNQFYGICMQVAEAVVDYQNPACGEEDEPQKELAETYLAVFDKKFPVLPTLKGKQLVDYKNFLNKCQQILGLKYWGIRPLQAKLFEKLSLLWAAWGAEHLKGLGQTDGDTDNEKQEWSEEDKKMSRFIGNAITADDASEYLKSKGIQVIDAHLWLEELKDRVQPKFEWNEEDEDILNTIINHFEIDLECTKNDDIINWLKSLKERYTWKPSDEQMENN